MLRTHYPEIADDHSEPPAERAKAHSFRMALLLMG